MLDANLTGTKAALASQVLDGVRAHLGEELWNAGLSESERQLVRSVCEDAVGVVTLAASGATQEAARERAQIDAQLANLASVEATRVSRAVWSTVATAARAALAVVLA